MYMMNFEVLHASKVLSAVGKITTVQLISKLTLACTEHACVLQFLSSDMHVKRMWHATGCTRAIFHALHASAIHVLHASGETACESDFVCCTWVTLLVCCTWVKRQIPQGTIHYSHFFVNLDVSCTVCSNMHFCCKNLNSYECLKKHDGTSAPLPSYSENMYTHMCTYTLMYLKLKPHCSYCIIVKIKVHLIEHSHLSIGS